MDRVYLKFNFTLGIKIFKTSNYIKQLVNKPMAIKLLIVFPVGNRDSFWRVTVYWANMPNIQVGFKMGITSKLYNFVLTHFLKKIKSVSLILKFSKDLLVDINALLKPS